MNIKRAFLAAVAVLMVPGFAMAQSTIYIDVGVNFVGLNDTEADGLQVEATVTCNAGVPLVQSAMVGQSEAPSTENRVQFTITEFVPGSCDVTFGDVPYTGWDYNPDQDMSACMGITADARCTAEIIAAPVKFSADVDWTFSDDADVSLADMAELEMWCDNVSTMTFDASSTSEELPGMLDVAPEDTCYARLTGVGSAILVDDTDCNPVAVTYGTDASCVITAGVFFEGIPTLSQYGMAIMALLMLAVGFVGFRRFV